MGIDEVGTITVEIFEKNAEQKINYESLKKSCSEASRNQSNFKAGNVRKLSHIIGDQVEFQKVALKTAFMVAPYRRPKRSMSTPLRNAPIPPWLLKAHSDLFDNSGIPMSPFEQRLRYCNSKT